VEQVVKQRDQRPRPWRVLEVAEGLHVHGLEAAEVA
jgi:hypothetical protein